MKIYLKREKSFPDTTIGHLIYDTTVVSTIENTKKLIPRGTYKLSLTWSPKFQKDLPLVQSVPNRRGIRIHAGNTYRDTSGCILVGCRASNPLCLFNSRTELQGFISWLKSHHNEIIYIVIS